MGLKLITPPSQLPITLEEVKERLRVDFSDEDDKIEELITAATRYLDGKNGRLSRALVEQTWELALDAFPRRRMLRSFSELHHVDPSEITIPLPPLIAIDSIAYTDANGSEQTLSSNQYEVDITSEPARLRPASGTCWPCTKCVMNAVRITFRAGYVDDAEPPVMAVPDDIKTAIALHVKSLYDEVPLPPDYDDTISIYQVRGF